MAINFSVIIPHKNIPVLLERLIASIPERDDLEIIVVDDHSDECIVDFVNFPGKERKNFLLLSNDGEKGAGYARNYALPYATGKWVLFADSDDYFNIGFDDFLNDYVESEADVVYFNANSVDTDTYEPSNRADHLNEFINNYQKDTKRGEIVMRYMFTEPWGKLIRRKLIEDFSIRFDETSIHEDVRFACLVGHFASKVIVDSRKLYCVTSRTDSLSRTLNYQKYLDEFLVFARWSVFLKKYQPSLKLLKFDFRVYHFTRHLWKNNRLFRDEYRILRKAGYGHFFIIGQVLYYIFKSVRYKLKL